MTQARRHRFLEVLELRLEDLGLRLQRRRANHGLYAEVDADGLIADVLVVELAGDEAHDEVLVEYGRFHEPIPLGVAESQDLLNPPLSSVLDGSRARRHAVRIPKRQRPSTLAAEIRLLSLPLAPEAELGAIADQVLDAILSWRTKPLPRPRSAV
ncbi:MAG: hypothetical protein U1E65_19940 [Myxococcota bacterium]